MRSAIVKIGCLIITIVWISKAINSDIIDYRATITSIIFVLVSVYLILGEFLKSKYTVFENNIFTRQIGTGNTKYNKTLGNIIFYTVSSYFLEFVLLYTEITGQNPMSNLLATRILFYLILFMFTIFSLYMTYALITGIAYLSKNKEKYT